MYDKLLDVGGIAPEGAPFQVISHQQAEGDRSVGLEEELRGPDPEVVSRQRRRSKNSKKCSYRQVFHSKFSGRLTNVELSYGPARTMAPVG